MKELVIISGKGGTGKTSVAASFAALADRPVIADCDVDAADLHLLLSPQVRERHEFRCGHEATIRQELCIGCGLCLTHCRYGAVVRASDAGLVPTGRVPSANCEDCDSCERSCPAKVLDMIRAMREAGGDMEVGAYAIDPVACEGCGVCVRVCPTQAIGFRERVCGEWMISDTRCGPLVHARLGIAAENSGKLVSTVRTEARRVAEEQGCSLIIVDGPPGIGCPVIASITGAAFVLAVTEPTPSGEHDLKRVAQLTRHFDMPLAVCVNKWDLNAEMSNRIEAYCRDESIALAGRVRYDPVFTHAQVRGRTVVEAVNGGVAEDVRGLWVAVRTELERGAHGAT
ncbi:MAG TPA: 4Fe-4S binding protein [Phycisphaerae bacterium]|nr:4Fe-4S binding protein [Phycisphaerae bacterium]HRY69801.1 4Fe-4S binding protein [Phycisphaerae bacterium]HSA25366.1 4Fe-4S binding protein [Phycisphaerae bacterium]